MTNIDEKGLKLHEGHYAELCTITDSPEEQNNCQGYISYRPGIGFYVGDNSIDDGDILILKPYMEHGWQIDDGPGVTFLRVEFRSEGLIE